ncbi:DNA-binding protein Mel-18, RING finger protein (macronuclear) [Tetrahymena thermophila SB210]|uniref:DNA-binding protein Mel-18, RING finger protein n=1 Tax=Tetrahymena thermophila (strain SB210) TaxID=312017 RepID=Q23JD8_TETTS|nr:DNA-binding protein Mel-18, RING finger protein [Tetrahymena thermophila SB210]EAR96566.1 DNA-binding protein Mel-18, RING finger protein [Tetrahymena thermophila SB210]|eukprot:XP_001016811.1 DNA-binding protein Mel-18, RING finger protein [Tetrahymena thermophila SB210]
MLEENNKGDFIQQEQDQFLEKKRFPLNLLNSFLVCGICDGYFRFAHTITECGHTFCKICIHDYISKNQNTKNKRKCPSCKGELEIHLSKSIRKDPYKQQMVDFLYPQFAKQEQLIVKRVKELFPLIDLEFLLDEFNYENLNQQQYQRKKKHSDSPKLNLKMVVDKYLNIPFDKFVQDLYEESSFLKMKQILLEKYPDYYKKQADTSNKSDQEENSSSSYEEDSEEKQKDPLQLNGKRKPSVQYEQQVQKKQQTNQSPAQRQIQAPAQNQTQSNQGRAPSPPQNQIQIPPTQVKLKKFPFKTSAPTERALEVFTSKTDRHRYISEKTLKSIQEHDDTLFKFYVNPLTNLEHEYVGLQNILRLQKKSNVQELSLKQVKSFFVKTIKAHTQQKNIDIPTISSNNVNLYFCEQLLCDISTPLKEIYEQVNDSQPFIFDYEIVLDNLEQNSS